MRRLAAALVAALALSLTPSALAAPPSYGPPAAPRYDAAGSSKATRASASATSSVSIVDYAFTPGTISVNAGDTVTWTDNGTDADGHTVTGSGLNSALLHTGNTYSFTFSQPGTFSYACSVHPKMKGSVTVLAKATTPSKGNAAKGGNSGSGSSKAPAAPSQGSAAGADPAPAAAAGSESAAVDSAGAAGSQASLPSTGSETLALLVVGLALLGCGLVLRARARQAYPRPSTR